MITENEMSIEIIEVQSVGDRLIVAGQLLSGEVKTGMLLESETNARYEVTGIGFVPPEGYSAGRRALTLVQLDESDLVTGSMLHQVKETTPPTNDVV